MSPAVVRGAAEEVRAGEGVHRAEPGGPGQHPEGADGGQRPVRHGPQGAGPHGAAVERHGADAGGVLRGLRGPDEEVPGGQGVLRRPGGQGLAAAGAGQDPVPGPGGAEEGRAGPVRGPTPGVQGYGPRGSHPQDAWWMVLDFHHG